MSGAPFDHVYLSPHLDDAAFSCGGAIAGARARGERVLVVTVCAGIPGSEVVPPAFVEAVYRQAGLSAADVVRLRLEEDLRAMHLLDVEHQWSEELDAILRSPDRYSTLLSLCGPVAQGEPLVAAAQKLARTVAPGALLHAPLGAGSHVDHVVVSDAALSAGRPVVLYEDLPYAALDPNAVVRRLLELGEDLVEVVTDISVTLGRKIAAVECYGSQGGSASRMTSLLEEYAGAVGAGVPSERGFARPERRGAT